MSALSTSSSQRPSHATQSLRAQLDASHSPAQPAFLPSSEDADFDSSVSRLLQQEANESNLDSDLDGDLDSVPGAEDEPESAPRPRRRRRPRVPEYIPRRRNHGELRDLVEGVDYDLTDLHEPDLRIRDHPPPPELLYESFDDAIAGVTAWARDHGVSYNRHNWARGGRYRLLMTCHRRGKPREAGDSSVSRKRPGATSQRTGCKMQFWLVANDYTQLDGQWRVKWCENRASISHNHPPAPSAKSIASHRRATRTDEMRRHLQVIWPLARGAKQALTLVQEKFPEALLNRQDIINEYRLWQQREQSK
ncbi:hypothetical protein E4U09_004424 [Claviceps aff. purpurea]|uniref:FAR1 domain-containing protein n=1 Tax=Claviceps aff. purpurea TaxID=1967640 RepID=A0A9P7QFT3_9HYPO|nr:hypothetical protein E4U09_004424 [Claviceps aff. purpurea]